MMQDLRQAGVADGGVLAAMEATPRELFLTDHFKAQAYEDATLPIGYQQTLSAPAVVAKMTEALEITDRMKVLEIGTGSGYQAAVLAQLCRRLYSIERHPALLQDAEDRFQELGLVNITTQAGDGSLGWPEQAPFERIMVTAAAADVPDALLGQLAEGGIMIVPVGLDENDQYLLKLRRGEDGIETEELGPTRFVPLIAGLAGP
ncbi:MAG TPA: protein-L-isoaspartate(D-aspartate) O-methyltransferase [Rhodospirillales bacterium]|jgi:protein-L-isoaspartate(D-aspartate) O-methyltransferase|nr:MAG: Protein-L-isoaspartate O-methyltransferase [Alphaproteobacteria bacterium MarineAlpha3_Bin1]PPR71829.1 MAG: Protein-L-isoaspartate O-methyltransferase [Alphaproteobacteria bacterium MarineAlpha3_Bin2]HIM78165.1 protein-L-isoaspartate(D-aspartate) O-methyltransferase [Rhodospirillales bacterium]